MKKIILGAWFAVLGLNAAAQNNATAVTASMAGMPKVSTNEEIRALASQLQLNEGQYIRLRDLSKGRLEQIAEINSMYSNDPSMRQAKLQAAQQEFDAQLAQAIAPKQFTAYLELQGRTPGSSGTAYQAGGYGGRSLEEGATGNTQARPATSSSPATTAPLAQPLDTNIDKGRVEVTERVVKINTEEGKMKVKANKEKAETDDMKYKADRDETKIKSRDGKIKAKSEKGKMKIETPKGKVKLDDGEVKVSPREG